MEATVLIGDYARAVENKLDVIGAGWTHTGPGAVNFGIGIIVSVSWDEANTKHHFVLDLLDADGRAVMAPDGSQPLLHAEFAEFEVGRPPGMRPGTSQNVALALNVAGMPLPAGERYQLRLVPDGDEDAAVSVAFETRHAAPEHI
jgi:Family of unknown function (DUF6941)